jgi:hypothetical protein
MIDMRFYWINRLRCQRRDCPLAPLPWQRCWLLHQASCPFPSLVHAHPVPPWSFVHHSWFGTRVCWYNITTNVTNDKCQTVLFTG